MVDSHEEQLGLEVEVHHFELSSVKVHVGQFLDQKVVVLDQLEADVLLIRLQIHLFDADVQFGLHDLQVQVQDHGRVDGFGSVLLEPLFFLVFLVELHFLLLKVAD